MSTEKPKKRTLKEIKNELHTAWFWYKVCEGCETVTMFSTTFCPVCRGYHFDENRRRIIDQVLLKYEEKFKRENDSESKEYSDLDFD